MFDYDGCIDPTCDCHAESTDEQFGSWESQKER